MATIRKIRWAIMTEWDKNSFLMIRKVMLVAVLLVAVAGFSEITVTYEEMTERLSELFEMERHELPEGIRYSGRYKTSMLEVFCQGSEVSYTTLTLEFTDDHVENVVAFLHLTVWLQDTLPDYADGWEEIIDIMKEMMAEPRWEETLERGGGNIRIEMKHIPLVGKIFTYTID